ncbi:MAG: hypothetical protein HDT39_11365 [Lachnospiraceae bacterium]|nr:hypothetical protein [Lachnospiraceae bacterium]
MLCFGIISLAGCGEEQESETLQADKTVQNTESLQASKSEQETESESAKEENRMKVSIGNSVFTATLENNSAVDSLIEMMQSEPLVIDMRDYSGFEKVGSLGKSLPANNRQTTTQSGDIVLYNGDQIVIFYGSNSWSYTRIGRIDDLSGWEDALGSGSVTVTFSID